MNLEEAKENIQPLASGRNIQRLETALSAESHEDRQAELLQERRAYEEAIQTYAGADPLGPWYDYVLWVEQSYPKSGKQSALDDVIQKCLLTFDQDTRYNQDPRLIKLYTKYIDSQPNPTEHFQTLYNSGIGTMVADLYICWAYFYDVSDNFEKAESVFRKGKDARAEPADALDLAHKQFGFSMSQRLLHKEDYRQDFLSTMEERRYALTSLRSQRGGQQVGSIRTGAAVKSLVPGRVDQHQPKNTTKFGASNSNASISVFVGDQIDGTSEFGAAAAPRSVVQSIMDSSRKQENLREPGPWSKSGSKSTKLFGHSVAPSFPILEDMDLDTTHIPLDPIPMSAIENNYSRPIQLPRNFVTKNEKPTPFPTLHFVAEPVTARAIPEYDKCLVFPRPTESFSIEELAAYRYYKKRHIQNGFTNQQDSIWLNEPSTGIRLYPLWCSECDKQEEWNTERFIVEDSIQPGKSQFAFNIDTIYPPNSTEELTNEDHLFAKWNRGEMESQKKVDEVVGNESTDFMDETIPVVGRQSIMRGAIRKSVVPGGRKSIFPVAEDPMRSVSSSKPSMVREVEAKPSIFKAIFSTPSITEEEYPAQIDPYTLEGKKMLYTSLNTTSGPRTAPKSDPYKPAPFPFEPKPLERLIAADTDGPVQPPQIEAEDQKFIKRRVLFGGTTVPDVPAASSSGLFQTGVIRKSICAAIKRKNESPTRPEVPAKENCLEDIAEQTEPTEKGFAIFEDSGSGATAGAIFKTPNPLVHRQPFGLRPSHKDDEEEAKTEEADQGYQANETCSTQQFLFFLKAQSVSTPKAVRRPPTDRPAETSPKETPFVIPVPPTTNPEVATGQSEISPQPRQLSTIMETTESTAQMSSSSSERDSDYTSKTISRPGILAHKPIHHLPVVAEHQAMNLHPSEIPTLCPLPLAEEPTETMPVFQIPVESMSFSVRQMPREPTTTTMPSMCPIPIFQDQTLPEMPPFSIHCDDTIPQIPTAPPTHPGIIEIYEDDTEPTPAIPKGSADSEIKVLNVLTDRIIPKPPAAPLHSSVEPMNPFSPTVSLDRTEFQPLPASDMSIPSMSCFPETTTGQLPVISLASGPVAPTLTSNHAINASLVNPFAPKAKLERTLVQPMYSPDMTIPSISLLDDGTTQQLPVISFAKPAPVSDQQDNSRKATEPPKPMPEMHFKIGTPVTMTKNSDPHHTKVFAKNDEPQIAKPKSSDVDDDFLDIFTKSPERSTHFAKPPGSSVKKGCSRIPVAACKSASKEKESVPDRSRFDLSSFHIKSEPIDASSASHQVSAASMAHKISFDLDDIMSSLDGASGASAAASVAPPTPSLSSRSIHAGKTKPEFLANEYSTWAELTCVGNVESEYVTPMVDLNETRQVIEAHLDDVYSNPFDDNIKAAFLDQCDFVDYLKNLDVCSMVNTLRPVHPKSRLSIGNRSFDVQSLIGKGNFGHVFSAQCRTTGHMYALKQERPANLWEYYICLEIESRIVDVPNMMNAFMSIECALIGNNASILVSLFGKHGSLISICNKVRQTTSKNIAEPVVMMLAVQMLSIVDHLHACKIIHADIKPDNILLVERLSYDHHEMCIQLIDFGQAIDMKLYPEGQRFRSKITTQNFVCTEMLDDKPWTYQTDLYCLAATIYTLLFGADMKVRKAPMGYQLATSIPRYYCKWMWESIFNTLINVKDCRSMPNLQSLRNMLLHEVSNEKERPTREAIVRFNNIIGMK